MKDKRFVILQHRMMPDKGICFFTTNSNDPDVEFGINGEHWYKVVGYADTVEEAQTLIAKNTVYPTMREIESYYRNR
jgi:hypothetical protein